MSVLHILAWKERTGNKIKNTKQKQNKVKQKQGLKQKKNQTEKKVSK